MAAGRLYSHLKPILKSALLEFKTQEESKSSELKNKKLTFKITKDQKNEILAIVEKIKHGYFVELMVYSYHNIGLLQVFQMILGLSKY